MTQATTPKGTTMTMKKFVTAVEDTEGDDRGAPIEYDIDGRKMQAFKPHEGQITFMLSALGRGQTDDQRYGSIVTIMLQSHRGSDKDYLEDRLLENDPKKRLRLPQLEEIFAFLTEEWFADPTQEQSDSVESASTGSQNSLPTTT